MKKFTSTLFLALILAITASSTFAQTAVPTGGQIPIGGRPSFQPNKTTAAEITATVEQKQDISSELPNYLWALVSVLRHFKF